MSQRPDWQKEVKNNKKNQTLIKLGWIKRTKTLVEENNLKKRIQKAQKKDKRVAKAVKELKKARIKILRNKEWTIEEEVVIKNRQIYILEEKLRGRSDMAIS